MPDPRELLEGAQFDPGVVTSASAAHAVPRPLERALLELVSHGGDKASWRWLATHLPRYDVPQAPDMMTALKALQGAGLLQRSELGNGTDRWSLTDAGQFRLVQLEGGREVPTQEPTPGPLPVDELQSLLTALRAGPEQAILAFIPHASDAARMVAVLKQVLAADESLVERVAFGGAMLPKRDHGEFARELLKDSRPAVRSAVFTSLHAKRMDVPGQAVRTLPDDEWDALLRAGVRDADASVRGAAAALAFASDRGAAVQAELLANLPQAEGTERHFTLLALGAGAPSAAVPHGSAAAQGGATAQAAASGAASEKPDLRQLLDAAELKYDLQLDARGRTCAVFRHEVVGHGMLDVSAWLEGQQLRFVAARVMQWDGSQEHLEWSFFVHLEWAYGSLFLDASGEWFDASVSMYVGNGVPGRNQVRYVVTHLAESVRRLRDGELPCYAPELGRRSTVAEVKQALVRCGLAPSTSPDGNTLGQRLDRGNVSVMVACYVFDEGTLLNVLFRFEPFWRVSDPARVVPLLHAINRDLPYGTVNLNPDTQAIECHMGIPVAWTIVDESLMRWAISAGLSALVDQVLAAVPLPRS